MSTCSCSFSPVACITSTPRRRPFSHKYEGVASKLAFGSLAQKDFYYLTIQKLTELLNGRKSFQSQVAKNFKPSQPFVRRLNELLTEAKQTIKQESVKLLDAFVDSAFEFVNQPLLPSQSNFAPVEEVDEAIRIGYIEGLIPDDFPVGVYIRNGPNPLFGGYKSAISVFGKSNHTWIEGEGMLHALYLQRSGESGSWTISYNNKYIESETFKLDKERKKPSFLPAIEGDSLAVFSALMLNLSRFGTADKYLSNTNVIEIGGRYYATAENHTPQEIDIMTLKTLGKWSLDSIWKRPFTSHPKKIPSTGEVLMYGIAAERPYMELGILSADGRRILYRADPNLDRCTLCHDIGVTERYNVILDFPLTIDINRLVKGGSLIKFDSQEHARIGVMPRYGNGASIRWFEVEPCNALHIVNCFEDGNQVIVRACKARGSILPGPEYGANKFEWFSRGFKHQTSAKDTKKDPQDGLFFTKVYEWRLNMNTGEVKGRNLTGKSSMDFPFINEKFTGLRNKYGYTQVVDSTESSNSGMSKYGGLAKLHFAETSSEISQDDKQQKDLIKVEYHEFPRGTFCSGASFVPKAGGIEEDDGWIITFVHDENTNSSQVHIIDAKKVLDEPVAQITLPQRVPYGFHGAFMPIRDGQQLAS